MEIRQTPYAPRHASGRAEELAKMDGLDLVDAEIVRNAWRCHDAEADVGSVVTRQNPEPHSTEGTR